MNQYSTIIGMDLGDKYYNWARMTQDNEVILEESRVRTKRRRRACVINEGFHAARCSQ